MRIIKIGDTVLASLFSGQKVTGKVEGIEICARGSGVTWQHENTGEQMEEYYQYTMKKIKLR